MFLWVRVSLPNNKLLENLENAKFFQVNVVFHFPLWDVSNVGSISPFVAGILLLGYLFYKKQTEGSKEVFPKTGKAGKQSDKRENRTASSP